MNLGHTKGITHAYICHDSTEVDWFFWTGPIVNL
jgi:hypothetical protein